MSSRRRPILGRRPHLLMAVLVGLLVIVACDGPSRRDRQDLGASTDPLLITDDEAFNAQLEISMGGAPNNYVMAYHTSLRYDENINPELEVGATQIGDFDAWTEFVSDEYIAEHERLQRQFSENPDTGGPCTTVQHNPTVVFCSEIPVPDDIPRAPNTEYNFDVYIRRFTPAETGVADREIVLTVGATKAGLEFISGSFTPITPDEAERRWGLTKLPR